MMTKALKAVLITTVSLVLVAAILVSILWYFAGKSDPVPVYPLYNYVLGYYDDSAQYDGPVSTNNLQAVYVSDTQTVTEIYVTEGQQVKKGEILFRYDTTLSDIQLSRQKIAVQQAEMDLTQAQTELTEIKNMKPYTGPPATRPTTAATTAPLESVDEMPYLICGAGTQEEPYHYLWSEDLTFDTDFLLQFINEQDREVWLAFEIREQNAIEGDLISLWGLHVTAIGEETEETPTEEEPEETPTEEEPAEEESTEDAAQELPEEASIELSYRFFTPEEIAHTTPVEIPTQTETEWIDTSSGYTAAEIAVMKQEKELEIRDLNLALRMAKLEYERMKKEVGTGVVYASIDGTVTNLIDADTAKATAEPLLRLSEGGTFYVTITIGEYERDDYAVGATANVTSMMNSGYETTGVLAYVSDEPTEGYYYGNPNVSLYEATLIVQGDALLQEGEWVSVQFHSDQADTDTTIYLESAYIRDDGGRSYVYKRGADGRLVKTYVQTGAVLWGYTAVLSGLTEEDWIAFPYGKDVTDGASTYEAGDTDYYGEFD